MHRRPTKLGELHWGANIIEVGIETRETSILVQRTHLVGVCVQVAVLCDKDGIKLKEKNVILGKQGQRDKRKKMWTMTRDGFCDETQSVSPA